MEVPASVATLTYGSLLAAAPNTVFYVGKYTARWRDPVLGPIVTHALVLVPILVSGTALFQSVHVRARWNRILTLLTTVSSSLPAQECREHADSGVPPPVYFVHIPFA